MESRLPFKISSTLPPRVKAQFALSILFSFILGVCFVEYAFDELDRLIKYAIGNIATNNRWSLVGRKGNEKLTDAVDKLKEFSTGLEKEQLDEIIEKGKTIIAGLYNEETTYNYEPIGRYITGWWAVFINLIMDFFIYGRNCYI